jgi:hypothetical protein
MQPASAKHVTPVANAPGVAVILGSYPPPPEPPLLFAGQCGLLLVLAALLVAAVGLYVGQRGTWLEAACDANRPTGCAAASSTEFLTQTSLSGTPDNDAVRAGGQRLPAH